MINSDHTLAALGMENNDEIDCWHFQTGGKPVVYLFSPEPLEASVKLSLVPKWNLSAIYTIVPIKLKTRLSNEEVSWRVRVHPNGERLTELSTKLDVAICSGRHSRALFCSSHFPNITKYLSLPFSAWTRRFLHRLLFPK